MINYWVKLQVYNQNEARIFHDESYRIFMAELENAMYFSLSRRAFLDNRKPGKSGFWMIWKLFLADFSIWLLFTVYLLFTVIDQTLNHTQSHSICELIDTSNQLNEFKKKIGNFFFHIILIIYDQYSELSFSWKKLIFLAHARRKKRMQFWFSSQTYKGEHFLRA